MLLSINSPLGCSIRISHFPRIITGVMKMANVAVMKMWHFPVHKENVCDMNSCSHLDSRYSLPTYIHHENALIQTYAFDPVCFFCNKINWQPSKLVIGLVPNGLLRSESGISWIPTLAHSPAVFYDAMTSNIPYSFLLFRPATPQIPTHIFSNDFLASAIFWSHVRSIDQELRIRKLWRFQKAVGKIIIFVWTM